MLKKILAAVAGIIVAGVVVGILQALSHLAFAPQVLPDRNDPQAMAAFVANLPVGAFLSVLASYVCGVLAGGFAAARIAGEKPGLFAGIVGAFVLLAGLANVFVIPHPVWFIVAVVVLVPAATWLAAHLGRKRG